MVKSKTKPVGRTIFWGIVSLLMYLAVFLNQQSITDVFTRGGIFAAPVIITALGFSLVHGAFANYFIEAIGFKPVSKGGH